MSTACLATGLCQHTGAGFMDLPWIRIMLDPFSIKGGLLIVGKELSLLMIGQQNVHILPFGQSVVDHELAFWGRINWVLQ